jgi:hypothetical protein
MTASTALRPSVRAAFGKLIDYAGLFPPAQLTLAQAADEYRAARAGPHAWMLGRFIIPVQLLAEHSEAFDGPYSVIADGDLERLTQVGALRQRGAKIEALEIPLRNDISTDDAVDAIEKLRSSLIALEPNDLPVFVEISRSGGWSTLRRAAFGAKLRCGGVSAEAFPSVDRVADFIAGAHTSGVPFKATAGLHHPVRHRDPATGFMMHGFLNILAAAALAGRVQTDTLKFVIAEEDPSAFGFEDDSFVWRDQRVSVDELHDVRQRGFVAYGSCSFAEPIEDLQALGILNSQ